jgi:hypothetical protein
LVFLKPCIYSDWGVKPQFFFVHTKDGACAEF